MLFQTLGGRIPGNSGNSGNSGKSPGHFCAISGNSGNSSRKKHVFYRIRSAQQGTLREFRGEIGTFSDIFFPEMSQICKKSAKKMQKNAKNAKKSVPKNTPKFWVFFIENRAVAICRSIEKSVENDTENPPCTLRAHFFFPKFPRGSFSGVFRDFQLRIGGKISEKKAFFRRFFGKNFHFFCVLPAGGRRPHFLHGAKIWTSLFFRKSAEHVFGFWVRFCAAFTRKIPSGRKETTPTDYPYRPLVAQGGVSFPYAFFVQIPGCEMASKKKSERFCSTII